MLQVTFRSIAQLEFHEATVWYDNKCPGLGLQFIESVEALVQQITRNPEIFPQVSGRTRRAILRRSPYTIHFIVETDQVVILAVFHASRDPSHLQDR
ncbi:type II toxin-antitoxin system RelE/ParE family toxin [Verrucomicrobia bacterium]|jgi:plasmid stabilization system protein ParE|nr:type II toxin-antitoxin system RelE/ParE family toxin [Verrucomicrobiota bacterium]MDB4798320.1 type II toxin-antitoxin system RelE/ParE family toxin [Verrucomicrobiota bacterium]